jgi:ABC-type branched-subunit amino acid transport system ATPase component
MIFYKSPLTPLYKGGKLRADGPPRAIQQTPEVIAAYLGTDWQG